MIFIIVVIRHPASNLLELPVNKGWSLFSLYSKRFDTKVSLDKQHCHCHAYHLTPDDDIDSSASKPVELSDDIFHVGETLLFCKEGRIVYVRVLQIVIGGDSVLRFKIQPSDGEVFETMREFLCDSDSPDIGWVPSTPLESKHAAADFPDKVKTVSLHLKFLCLNLLLNKLN